MKIQHPDLFRRKREITSKLTLIFYEFYDTVGGRSPYRNLLMNSRRTKTNFDLNLEEQLKDPVFAERFKRAGEGWDVALQLTALREKAGLSQKELARKLHTSQQNISRLESPSYEGHSLTMLRRVAQVLGATLRVTFSPEMECKPAMMSEAKGAYKIRRK
jgi:DNA-binding XRE family transcriptional regulator